MFHQGFLSTKLLQAGLTTFFVAAADEFLFIGFWNDYQVPLLYMPSYPTVAYGMYNMANTRENNLSSVPMRMTGAMLMFIPIFTLFLIFQKRLLGNLTVGGIKG